MLVDIGQPLLARGDIAPVGSKKNKTFLRSEKRLKIPASKKPRLRYTIPKKIPMISCRMEQPVSPIDALVKVMMYPTTTTNRKRELSCCASCDDEVEDLSMMVSSVSIIVALLPPKYLRALQGSVNSA